MTKVDDKIDERIEQGNLRRQLREFWPEVQRYTGLKYAFDRRVLVQVGARTTWYVLEGIGLFCAVVMVVGFFIAMAMDKAIPMIICVMSFIVCAILSLFASRKCDSFLPNDLLTLSYSCRSADFLTRRLESVQYWQEKVKPSMDKILRLKPIIEDELGFTLLLFCRDDLQDYIVSSDLLSNVSCKSCSDEVIYGALFVAIVEEREKRERDRRKSIAHRRAIEELKKELNW